MGTVATVFSVAPVGFDGQIVEVESDLTKGLPAFQLVGLANKSIDEAKERVKSALTNSLLEYPAKRITVNLAPAELPKAGTHYDLPIALAILVSSGQLRPTEIDGAAFAGELALTGNLRPISGAVTIAETAMKAGKHTLYLPVENVPQAMLVEGLDIVGVSSLKQLYLHLKAEQRITQPTSTTQEPSQASTADGPSLDDVRGQAQAKRALTIAAAGRHNILLSGPPGAGKTMLAKVLADLLPDLSSQERLAVTKIYSLAGELIDDALTKRPFRAPHHTSSRVALTGGGTSPRPGEVSLAHMGVLFLDEIPEYPRSTLEALRQPLEDRTITVSRANAKARYPADFMLVATMNPCPCGYYGDDEKECSCSAQHIANYQRRLSGPLLDRIDMKIAVKRVENSEIVHAESTSYIQHIAAKKSIDAARAIQLQRYESSVQYNSNLSNRALHSSVSATSEASDLLIKAADSLGLSARATLKSLKVARTIADLDNSVHVMPSHISEALQYR